MASPDGEPTLPLSLPARIAARESWAVAVCLIALTALAWWWLWRGGLMGGMASEPMAMPMPVPMEGMAMPAAAPEPWTGAYLASAFAMWATMMVAMMLPTAAPMILLHAAVARRNALGSAATGLFAAGYLLVWAGFALASAVAQAALVASGLVEQATLAVGGSRLAAGLLFAAALYELTPLKRACLAACQSPVGFLMRYWRKGKAGALRMGLRHGAFCLGCCWVLMLLLFVGGVMNLAWIALLTLVVLAEKYLPPAWRADRLLGGLLLLAAVASALR